MPRQRASLLTRLREECENLKLDAANDAERYRSAQGEIARLRKELSIETAVGITLKGNNAFLKQENELLAVENTDLRTKLAEMKGELSWAWESHCY